MERGLEDMFSLNSVLMSRGNIVQTPESLALLKRFLEFRLKVIANEQLSSGTVYYNVNTDILRISKAIKSGNVRLLSQLARKIEKEYGITD